MSPVAAQRVDTNDDRPNSHQPKKKQLFLLGTQAKVKEKNATCVGEATECDPHTGLHHTTFEDGEFEEFNNDEMAHFWLQAPKT